MRYPLSTCWRNSACTLRAVRPPQRDVSGVRYDNSTVNAWGHGAAARCNHVLRCRVKIRLTHPASSPTASPAGPACAPIAS